MDNKKEEFAGEHSGRAQHGVAVRLMEKKKNKMTINQPNPDLPQLNFFCIITGPRGKGKSNLCKNLLLRHDMLRDIFEPDCVFIFSASVDINHDYDDVKTLYKFPTFSSKLINSLMDIQKRIIKEFGIKKCKPMLLVFDDMLDSGAFNYNSILEKIAVRGRHLNISCIVISQSYNRISRTMRINTDYLIFFEPNNLGELDRVAEQNVDKGSRKEFIKKIKDIFSSEPYSFITIDYKTKNQKRRFRKGFSALMLA